MVVDRTQIISILLQVAPDIEASDVLDNDNLREKFDLDSVDHLNFIRKLHQTFQVEIPEKDYAQLGTVAAIKAFLASK